jgi:hypothetical protein
MRGSLKIITVNSPIITTDLIKHITKKQPDTLLNSKYGIKNKRQKIGKKPQNNKPKSNQ